jgi:hypothetical protein
MRIHKIYIALGLMIALSMFLELVAHASETNELTKITFNTPVQLPDRVLPAGTYTFQVAGNGDNPDLVQIFNAEGTALLATFETASAERTRVTSHTSITLAKPDANGPEVLVKWFYPGSSTGHEFIYSKQQEQEIARATPETFVGGRVMPSTQAAGE